MIFLTTFLKSGIPALLHPVWRRRSHVPPQSTSRINRTRVVRGTEHAAILRLMASKKIAGKERVVPTADAPGMPRTPELTHPLLDRHQSQHAAHDRIILEQLLSGDTRALATLLLSGHIPGPTVRQCLALMLLDWPEAEAAVAAKPALNQKLWQLPFRLIAKSRPRKRGHQSAEKDEGTILQGAHVKRLVGELSYDAAIARVNEAIWSLINPRPSGQPGPGSDAPKDLRERPSPPQSLRKVAGCIPCGRLARHPLHDRGWSPLTKVAA
jgi:hypothetical protein